MMRAILGTIIVVAATVTGGLTAALAEQVRVYCAASLTTAVTALAQRYEANDLGDVTLVTGPSGALANQIVHGAPADVFLSANRDWIEFLIENQATADDAVRSFASNELVLVAPQGSDLSADLADPETLADALAGRRVVIGDPAVAPVGVYARQALTSLGLWAALEPELVYAQDASAALAYVNRGAVDAGIVYRTDAALTDVLVLAALPAASHDPILYFAAPVAGGNAAAADAFLSLLTGPEGRAVLTELGFSLEPTDTENPVQ